MSKIRPRRSTVVLSLAAAALLACSSAPPDEEAAATSEAGLSSCATSQPDGAGGVWLNFRAEEIGCPNDPLVNGVVRLPAGYDGHLMQGRIRCGYEWLRSNQPEVFQALGQVSSNETHYFSPDGFDAWYNQFATGSKVQFEWRGPCADGGNGFVKFYVVPCSFVASTVPGGTLFESPSCGTTARITHDFDGSVLVDATSGGVHGVIRMHPSASGGFQTTLLEGDFHAAQVALAEVKRAQEYHRVSPKPGAPFDWGCFAAVTGVVVATGSTVAACIVPEPLEPVACGLAIGGTVSATGWFAASCH